MNTTLPGMPAADPRPPPDDPAALAPRPAVGAVLLAAGAGSRLGGRPKALLELDGVPLVRRQLLALSAAGVDTVVLVLGHHADRVEAAVHGLAVTLVRNPRPDDGQVSSQRLGLATLPGALDAVMVALADQPLIGAPEVSALMDAYVRRPPGTSFVYPRVGGQPGNPVIFGAAVREQILAGAAGHGGRQWRQAHPEAVHAFVTDNRHYRLDVDSEADLVRFEHETGRALRWPAAAAPGRSRA